MLQWGSVEMNEIIQEMAALMRDEAAQRSIVIRAEMAENLRPITEDRVQLQQVLLNLMINAMDAVKDADGTRGLAINSQRESGMTKSWDRSAIQAWAYRRGKQTRSLMRSLPRNLMGAAWDFAFAVPSLNGALAACGPPTTLQAEQVFTLSCRLKPRLTNELQCDSFRRGPASSTNFFAAALSKS
jgi:hypothetical protein